MLLPRMFFGTERLAGVLGWGARVGPQGAEQLLDELLELGDVGLDLAASYQLGASERLVGRWLRRHRREGVFLLSKGGHPFPVLAPNRLTRQALSADLHGSLDRLGTDHLDLFLLHRDHEAVDLEELAALLAGFQKAGLVRGFGVSNWRHERVAALAEVVERHHGIGLMASSPQFSLAYWTEPLWTGTVSLSGPKEAAGREFYARTGLPVVAYSPLGRGALSSHAGVPTQFAHPENQRRRERAQQLARALGWAPVDVALAYLVSQPFPVHPVVATYNLEHLRGNHRALSLRLSEAQCRFLEDGGDLLSVVEGPSS